MTSKTKFTLAFALSAIIPFQSFAVTPYSKKAGQAYANLPNVKKGGTIYLRQLGNPAALSPLLTEDQDYKDTLHLIFSRFMEKDYDTGEYFPLLAEKVDVSKDHKVMTYTIRKEAVWEDGTPVTADDVEFTFTKLMDLKVQAAPLRAYFEGYKFEKLDIQTVRFTTDKPNVNSLNELNDDFMIIQKKQYDGVEDFNKAKGIIAPIGNGPYKLKSFSRDQKVEFERNKDWWGYKLAPFKNMHNFDNVVWRVISDNALAYEKLIKGEIDVLVMNAELYGNRVKGSDKEKFGSTPDTDKALWADHFRTKCPAQWSYVGWNMKRPIFQSKKTRQALAMLINYDEIIDKVYHKEAIRSVSPFGSSTPNTAPDQKSKAFKFDPVKAIAMLKEDGWADMDHDNTLSKMIDGKKTKFEFVLRYNSENPLRSKMAQIIKEQFKKAGVIVNVQAPEFNTLITQMNDRDFDAIIMGWGGGMLYADSKQIWHSKSAENKGSNSVSYSNPEVDKLIEQASAEVDVQKHYKLNQKIGTMIYDDQPYAFLLEVPGYMAAFQSRKMKAKKWSYTFDTNVPFWTYAQ